MRVIKTKHGSFSLPEDPIKQRFYRYYDEVMKEDPKARVTVTKSATFIDGNLSPALRKKIEGE